MNRVLILDDDQAVLNWLYLVFAQTRRFVVEALQDSTKALAAIDSGAFDVILVDLDMPEVSGLDVLRHVRRNHPGVEVIVITGVDDVSLAVQAMKLDAYDYLCKPVDADTVVQCVDRALERASLRDELRRLEGRPRRDLRPS